MMMNEETEREREREERALNERITKRMYCIRFNIH